jgi:hypothetical protein
VQRPTETPFLKALVWQRTDSSHLSDLEVLRLYERNWRQRGVIAEPNPEELEYIRQLVNHYGSDLYAALGI